MSDQHPVQVIAITSGKGGVGKSNVALNMSIALADTGRRVTLLDADLGLANVDILLGLTATKNLEQVLSGECSLMDIMVTGPGGIRIVPASSGTQAMVSLSPREHAGLIQAFSELGNQIDTLIIDTAAGISDTVLSFVCAAHEVVLVVCDEPTSITDAYALIKLLNQEHNLSRFKMVTNMTRTKQQGEALYRKLQRVADRFLDISLEHVGVIPFDDSVRKSVQRQKAVYEAYPSCKASIAYRELAEKANRWPLVSSSRGQLEFFVEQLVASEVRL